MFFLKLSWGLKILNSKEGNNSTKMNFELPNKISSIFWTSGFKKSLPIYKSIDWYNQFILHFFFFFHLILYKLFEVPHKNLVVNWKNCNWIFKYLMVLLVVLVSTYTASRTNPIKCLVLLGFHGVNHRLVLIFPRQSALKRAMVFGFCRSVGDFNAAAKIWCEKKN